MIHHFGFESSVTLGDALQTFRASEVENDATERLADIEELFEQHDAVHVLFGCGTSIQDEIYAHVWMIFATTANVGEMHQAVSNQEHRNVLSGIGHFKLFRAWVKCFPRIINIILKSLRMKKRVALDRLSQLKERPLLEIRQEHGIVL